jgi:hypothetical protein
MNERREHELMTAWVIIFLVVIIILGLGAITKAWAHDVYTQLRSPAGQLCCGGDPVTGDCEGIVNPVQREDGSALFYSKRYSHTVQIAAQKIVWMPVPGGEDYEAHWCGVPRYKVYLAPINADNPDQDFWTR